MSRPLLAARATIGDRPVSARYGNDAISSSDTFRNGQQSVIAFDNHRFAGRS